MDRPDPFYAVRDEILKSLKQAEAQFETWKHEIISKSSNSKPAETALRETVRNIDWDLADLQETVLFVEKNPTNFSISAEELRSRQRFLQDVKTIVKGVKSRLYDPSELLNGTDKSIRFEVSTTSPVSSSAVNGVNLTNTPSVPGSARLTAKTDGGGEKEAGGFTDELKWRSKHPGTDAPGLLAEQVALLKEQDEHLDRLGSSISRLKQMSHRIGGELDSQVALLDEFGEEMTNTETRLENAMRRAARLLHIDSSRAQWFVIGVLLLTLLSILILFAVL